MKGEKLTLEKLYQEEINGRLDEASSAKSYSWIIKGEITKLALCSCKLVLNVGCGFGRELVHLPPSTVGVDIGLQICRVAKKVSGREVVCADAHFLPFIGGVFDGLAMAEVIEHLTNPVKALHEVSRVMEEKGVIVLQTPNRFVTFGVAISKECGHIHEFIPQEIVCLMERAGFTTLKRTGSTLPYVPTTSRFFSLNSGTVFRIWKWANRYLKLVNWDIIVLGTKRKSSQATPL